MIKAIRNVAFASLCVFLVAGSSCPSNSSGDGQGGGDDIGAGTMVLLSNAFTNNGTIPVAHAVAGTDLSPQLSWSGAPAGTQQYALVMTDISFVDPLVHWVVYSIPGIVNTLPEGVPAGDSVADPAGAKQGLNFLSTTAYTGPDPGPETHQYKFELYALDEVLSLGDQLTRAELLTAMQGHILAKAELVGSYTGS